MLIGGDNKTAKRYSDGFDEGYVADVEYAATLIAQRCFAEAWEVMSACKQESIPLLYNQALCLKSGGEYFPRVLELFERLQRLAALLPRDSRTLIQADTTSIFKAQREEQTHNAPITFRYVDRFPHLLKDSILRHLIGCHLIMGNHAKVIELGTPLASKGYKDVVDALEIVTKK